MKIKCIHLGKVQDDDMFCLTLQRDGNIFQENLERSQLRHLIEQIDNAI